MLLQFWQQLDAFWIYVAIFLYEQEDKKACVCIVYVILAIRVQNSSLNLTQDTVLYIIFRP